MQINKRGGSTPVFSKLKASHVHRKKIKRLHVCSSLQSSILSKGKSITLKNLQKKTSAATKAAGKRVKGKMQLLRKINKGLYSSPIELKFSFITD